MAELAIPADLLDTFTLDDLTTIEDIVGVPFDELFGGTVAVPKGKLMKGLAFVLMRQSNPDITLEDVGKLTMSHLQTLLAEVVPVPPADAAS